MRYLDEYRDPELAKKLFDEIDSITTQHLSLIHI